MNLPRRLSLGLALLLMASATHLSGQTVGVSNLGFAPAGDTTVTPNHFVAASFTTDATYAQYTLSAVTLPVDGSFGVTDFTVSLYTNSGSNLPGQLVGVLAGTPSPGSGLFDFTNSAVTLDANATYWITWGFTNGNNFQAPEMNVTTSTGAWTLGITPAFSSNGGANWSAGLVGWPMQFSVEAVNAAAIPEPSTYAALAGLGALSLAVLRRRRA